jgi:hypothetical protein
MITKKNATRTGGTHQASFRISDEQHQEFLALLEAVPGSDVGNMYREIFARGLKSLKGFYAKQGLIENDDSSEKKGA